MPKPNQSQIIFIIIAIVLAVITLTITLYTQPSVGAITGSVSYPSEVILNGLIVCAINQSTQAEKCTGPFHAPTQSGAGFIQDNRFTYGIGYQLQLTPGVYQVYATANQLDNYKAYYSQLMPCIDYSENSPDSICNDHTPINVTVTAGHTITNIDPGDWYAP